MQKNIFFIIISLFIGVSIGWVTYQLWNSSNNNISKKCSDQYSFLSSKLDCGNIDEDIVQVETVQRKVASIINQEKQANNVDEIAVFFRDLNTTRWFGINENINFYPASLAKLPFVMMMYKYAEVDKNILSDQVIIDNSDLKLNEGQHYPPAENLLAEKSYPISELLRRLLVYSDNAPINKLTEISAPLQNPILDDLGVIFPPDTKTGEAQWNITPKIYANFFRILYNASYLRPEYSNTILDQLSQSTFKNTLPAGIPKGTKIAHKFGEISSINPQTNINTVVLNDCGIIYKKNNPYILCVMTRGNDYTKLEHIIKNISSTVYQSASE